MSVKRNLLLRSESRGIVYTLDDDDVILSAVRVSKLQQLPAFADLLTTYMERTGIGDTELARRIPVSRPTLIRWKEGVTTRPRYREDVVRCAELLLLTPEEQDEFLLAAGFSPDTPSIPEETSAIATVPEAVPSETPVSTEITAVPPAPTARTEEPPGLSRASFLRRWGLRLGLLAASLVIVALVAVLVMFVVMDRTVYPVASPGEALIVLAPFVNYTAGQQGFNVPGRLKEEIDREVRAAGISGVSTVEWPKRIHEETEAEAAGSRADAMLVIWGEYDSGRVIARFTVPDSRSEQRDQQVVDIASTPSELPATINIGLTEEVRYVALLTLGQLHLEQGEYDLAKAALIRALTKPPADPSALSNLRFNLGLAYRGGRKADFDIAIWLFSQVLSTDPDSVEAYNSRALTYLDRGERGDVELALDDLERALDIEPDRAATYLNLAVAYIERGGRDDLERAIADLDKALELNSDYASAYVNRSAAYIARGEPDDLDRAFDDISMALETQPDLASAYVGLGNAYLNRSLPGDLELALGEFSRAIDLDATYARAYFNRGLVHSELENLGSSVSDLRRAQGLKPTDITFNNTLCWQMAVTGDPENALRFCNISATQDSSGRTLDSRGFAHALLGEYDKAVADFERFLGWTKTSPKESCTAYYHPSRSEWIEELRAGQNPFDNQRLTDMRIRPVPFGEAPC